MHPMRTINGDLQAKLPLCAGCRNDFYNQPGNSTAGHCWSLTNALVVVRYRIGWWNQPTNPGAFTKVVTLGCHHAPGKYAHQKQLPDHCPDRAEVEAKTPVDPRPL